MYEIYVNKRVDCCHKQRYDCVIPVTLNLDLSISL